MKVLDLQCPAHHEFEGWFASEDDFQAQLAASQVECPLCGATNLTKRLSAPRLNLGSGKAPEQAQAPQSVAMAVPDSPQAKMLQAMRQWVHQSVDVGEHFSDEARRIHSGEVPARNIRGQATLEQTCELLEEGIAVMPLPDLFKDTLH